ncbi:DUF2793 domain-containing protein [Hyphomonas sp.]|uniref:DUF2793 domain-containing protein n=1 Tax=Hyphomonas sp. TaxID=87 RepID=UPI0030FAC3BE
MAHSGKPVPRSASWIRPLASPCPALPPAQSGAETRHAEPVATGARHPDRPQRALTHAVGTARHTPVEGDGYILPADASGDAWTGFEPDSVAAYLDATWITLTPPEGCRAWVEDEHTLIVFTSGT